MDTKQLETLLARINQNENQSVKLTTALMAFQEAIEGLTQQLDTSLDATKLQKLLTKSTKMISRSSKLEERLASMEAKIAAVKDEKLTSSHKALYHNDDYYVISNDREKVYHCKGEEKKIVKAYTFYGEKDTEVVQVFALLLFRQTIIVLTEGGRLQTLEGEPLPMQDVVSVVCSVNGLVYLNGQRELIYYNGLVSKVVADHVVSFDVPKEDTVFFSCVEEQGEDCEVEEYWCDLSGEQIMPRRMVE